LQTREPNSKEGASSLDNSKVPYCGWYFRDPAAKHYIARAALISAWFFDVTVFEQVSQLVVRNQNARYRDNKRFWGVENPILLDVAARSGAPVSPGRTARGVSADFHSIGTLIKDSGECLYPLQCNIAANMSNALCDVSV
jgi:hypothetical protein